MAIKKKRKKIANELESGQEIKGYPTVSQYKYLGTIMNQTLDPSFHLS